MDQQLTNGLQKLKWRRILPWLHLFSAFRLGLNFSKILLAVAGLLLLNVGNILIEYLPFAAEHDAHLVTPWSTGRIGIWGNPADVIVQDVKIILRPFRDLTGAITILCFGSNLTWEQIAYATTKFLWALGVWSLFAGAITRISAVQFARDESPGMLQALRFSFGHYLSLFSAPLLPLAGFIVFMLLCLLARLVIGIPMLGQPLVGIFWFIPILFGVLMTLIFFGVVAGWPLMLPVISTEGSDAFDGFSRSYSYLYNGIWRYVWLLICAALYGVVIVIVSTTFINLVVHFTTRPTIPGTDVTMLVKNHFEMILTERFDADWSLMMNDLSGSQKLMFNLVDSWLHVLALLLVGFFVSYFWTAWTIIYFLLRQADDGVALDQVYLSPEQEEQDALLPLVGVADSDQPIIEKPVSEELDESNAESQ